MSFVKPIREKGIVVGKRYVEAKSERTDMNGKLWPATPEKYLVTVISCDEDDFDEINGISNGTTLDYPVNKDTWNKVIFLNEAKVKYTASQFGEKLTTKPETFELIEK